MPVMTDTSTDTATAGLSDLLRAAVGAVPEGSSRPGQELMASAVAEAAESGEHLLVQAGTGTGKSLAYLVPALHSRQRVVVSTATIALQSQLINTDLPRLAKAARPVLGRLATFALLKGRHNYLCLAKLEGSTLEEPDDDDSSGGPKWIGQTNRLGAQMVRLREWADETDTGDRSELDPGVDDAIWRSVSMPARECVGASKCPFGTECFAEASRTKARDADIIVTNHSLLAADMMAGGHIIPEHQLLVLDEAHELVDRVTSAAQAELTSQSIHQLANRLRSTVDPKLHDELDGAAIALGNGIDAARVGRMEQLPAELRDAMIVLESATRRAAEAIGDISPDDEHSIAKQQSKSRAQSVRTTAQRLLEESDDDVAWISEDERGRRTLIVAPLSVAGQLGSLLFGERTVVATSATLALGGRFDLVAQSLGLNEKVPWRSLDVGSPFDYPKQGILYVAAHLPRPAMSGLSDAAGTELVELVSAAGGRTLGLFSSRRAASAAAEVLRAKTKLPILLQGEDSLDHLVRRFRAEEESCLLGVMSLWQGVDVPGPACQLVIIDRLPFPRPDDPLMSARAKAVDDSGGSGFMAISVPHAAVRLAQGAGRLIRTMGDRGVVAVLDSRLHSARYGEFIRRTLPPFWYTTSAETVKKALLRLSAD